jgi:hypothetical protein
MPSRFTRGEDLFSRGAIMPEYMHVPTPDILGAAVVHCTSCGKRLAPHDAFPVREEGGRWSCIVCPASIAPHTFTAPMLDASRPGLVRDVTIEVHARSLLVAADFAEQRPAIVAAFPEVVTEIANAAATGVKVERERVEKRVEKARDDIVTARAPYNIRTLVDKLLADIRSGATS